MPRNLEVPMKNNADEPTPPGDWWVCPACEKAFARCRRCPACGGPIAYMGPTSFTRPDGTTSRFVPTGPLVFVKGAKKSPDDEPGRKR